ncbi:hypothetical protein LEWO105114_12940 [Legionella worsleiensis]|nr:Uncharacterised protein [Legionella worsleiensis]
MILNRIECQGIDSVDVLKYESYVQSKNAF